MNHKHVFPDVNVLVHFPAFDGFDWNTVCNAEHVDVHITQPVLKELNKLKDTGHTKNVKRRAAAVQRRLKELLNSANRNISERVTIKFDAQSSRVNDHPGLDATVADDALIAAALTFAGQVGEPVYLMTDDSGLGLMVKAAEWKIEVIEPPEHLRLPPEIDADQKEKEKLQKRIALLENCRPSLDLVFVSGGKVLRATPLVTDIATDIASRTANLKKKHKKLVAREPMTQPKTGLKLKDFLNTKINLEDAVLADREKVETYNRDLDCFFEKAKDVIEQNATIRSRVAKLEIQVENRGPAPAKDILAEMHFPNGLKPLASSDLREVFKHMPTPPRDPTDFSWIRRGLNPSFGASLSSVYHRDPNAPSLVIEETNSFNVRWHVPKLRQGYISKVDEIFVLFDDEPFSFPIEYSIVAENSVDTVRGNLNVVVIRDSGSRGNGRETG
jgi:rRNA-processing protein FCF1